MTERALVQQVTRLVHQRRARGDHQRQMQFVPLMPRAERRMINAKLRSGSVMHRARGNQPANQRPRRGHGRRWRIVKNSRVRRTREAGARLPIASKPIAKIVLGSGKPFPTASGTTEKRDQRNGSRSANKNANAAKRATLKSARVVRSNGRPRHRNSAPSGGTTKMYRQIPPELHPVRGNPVRTRSRRRHRVLRQVGCRDDGAAVAIRVRKYQ